jgi:hypothetical protein
MSLFSLPRQSPMGDHPPPPTGLTVGWGKDESRKYFQMWSSSCGFDDFRHSAPLALRHVAPARPPPACTCAQPAPLPPVRVAVGVGGLCAVDVRLLPGDVPGQQQGEEGRRQTRIRRSVGGEKRGVTGDRVIQNSISGIFQRYTT